MNRLSLSALFVILCATPAFLSQDSSVENISVDGLKGTVEIVRDPWGVSHIYASSEDDLFFSQGFNAARDRLFQLEVWRRAATGTVSEVLGEKALQQDIGARLLGFRGDLAGELNHYHPRGVQIVEAFVRGVNAYIDLVEKKPGLLPLEFRLLGIRPGKWTPEVVVSRHNGLFRNAGVEIKLAEWAARIGPERLTDLLTLEPGRHRLEVPEGLRLDLISDSILELYRASRAAFAPKGEDIADPEWRNTGDSGDSAGESAMDHLERLNLGSNNWVIGPARTLNRSAFMANDPHRSEQIPSLRYFVHLVADGWNVIGGGEPALPGVSIGHNDQGAWGLTIFSIDQEDLYVYETEPGNPLRYRYRDGWEQMRELEEVIPVKGSEPRRVTLRFTRHGPVLFEDTKNHRAYALRAAWLEPGTAPYLPSLRFDQARTWDEFRAACAFFLAPSENMVWADREGNIGWQATGIAPLRQNWSGLLPVPGDGRFEWEGFLPVSELPHRLNPPEGFLSTANQENLPPGYPFQLGLQWSEPFRQARIQEFLGSGRLFSMADMIELQLDYLSLPARWVVPLLENLDSSDPAVRTGKELLLSWDFRLRKGSAAAALYMVWERTLTERVWDLHLPAEIKESFDSKSLRKAIEWLLAPDAAFGPNPVKARADLLLECLQSAVADLRNRFGPDVDSWRWGDERLHHIRFEHALSGAVQESHRDLLNAGPIPRGGSSTTVNMTNSQDRQESGASFRVIVDLGDWDRSLATNAPGQSGDPDSPHYRDLAQAWADGEYFPLLYSREKIEAAAEATTVLRPR
jgi:penicillin amidase